MGLENSSYRSKIDLSVVIPVYCSEKSLDELCERVLKVGQQLNLSMELILVDDCSLDLSWLAIERLAKQNASVKGFQLMANKGQGAATLCGLEKSRGEYIVTLDDDLQYAPEDILSLWERLQSDVSVDVVIGVPQARQHHFYRNLGSSLVNRMNSVFLKKPLDLKFSGFRMMRKAVVSGLLRIHTPYPAIGPMMFSVTPRIVNVPIMHSKRKYGVSNYNFTRLMRRYGGDRNLLCNGFIFSGTLSLGRC